MPQFIVEGEGVGLIGSVFLHLNPWVSLGSLMDESLMNKVTERACGQSPREFFNYTLIIYSVCIALSLILTLTVRKVKISKVKERM